MIDRYGSCTLLATLYDVPDSALVACVDWLVDNEFIRRSTTEYGFTFLFTDRFTRFYFIFSGSY